MFIENINTLLNNVFGELPDSIESFYSINYDISVMLVDYRLKHNLSQKDLSAMLDVSQAMISKYESGDYNFTLKKMCEICEKLDVKMDVKFTKKEEGFFQSGWEQLGLVTLHTQRGEMLCPAV